MKVLLAGEFSGIHNHLKKGLAHHKIYATTLNTNDSWKKFPSDIQINSTLRPPFRQISDEIGCRLIQYARQCENYDVLQLINPILSNTLRLQLAINNIFLHKYAIRRLIEKAGKTFLLGAGDEYYYMEAIRRGAFEYSPLPGMLQMDMPPWKRFYSQCWGTRKVLHKWNLELVERVQGLIPCVYEFDAGYALAGLSKARPLIRLPFYLDDVPFTVRKSLPQIRVLHTRTRPGTKGTPLIAEAFLLLRSRYLDVEFIVSGQQTVADYQKVIESVDIVVDQLYSYSYGMTAIYSLASGKVVLSGLEEVARKCLGVEKCPAILNVKPDVDDIVRKIEQAIETVRADRDIREKARGFVEQYHCAKKIAGEYMATWAATR